MSGIQCEICGGKIEMQAGGNKGICTKCGIVYSVERMRELYSGGPSSVQYTKNHSHDIMEFDIRDNVLVKYNGRKEKVIVPHGVVGIGESAFSGNSYVIEVVLPDTVKRIDESAFSSTDSLKKINLSNKITHIGPLAFCRSGLEQVIIPPVSKLEYQMFENCKNLVSVEITNGTKEIGGYGFRGCNKLSIVKLPDTLEIIGGNAFDGCGNLSYIKFPQNLKRIGRSSFIRSGLKSLEILSRNIYIGSSAFCQCYNLKIVKINSENVEWDDASPIDWTDEKVEEIICDEKFVDMLVDPRVKDNLLRFNGSAYVSDMEKIRRRGRGVCVYCGGSFKGVFSKTCSQCGRPKDY